MYTVVGVLNVTPDSFSDGGQFNSVEKACRHAELLMNEGADWIEVGGESTRPGSVPISIEEELDRVIPVITALKERIPLPIAVDTSHKEVMYEAVHAGATLINDVRAFTLPGALEAVAKLQVPICIMHMQNQPENMQKAPAYEDVTQDVLHFLTERIAACLLVGIQKNQIIADPGFGFGKTLQHNLTLMKNFHVFQTLEVPLMAAVSRKTMIGMMTNQPPQARLAGSLAGAVLLYQQGARWFRVHDVRATIDALQVTKLYLGDHVES